MMRKHDKAFLKMIGIMSIFIVAIILISVL